MGAGVTFCGVRSPVCQNTAVSENICRGSGVRDGNAGFCGRQRQTLSNDRDTENMSTRSSQLATYIQATYLRALVTRGVSLVVECKRILRQRRQGIGPLGPRALQLLGALENVAHRLVPTRPGVEP